jgi:hypothetical protein
MELIQERDRLIWEKTQAAKAKVPLGSVESARSPHHHLIVALNETKSLRDSGGQYGESNLPESLPRNFNG